MTAVLLIADSERVQRIFADLESKGVLQLHAAATLDQADQELGATLPAFTFVQSRISGLSTAILLRHLKKRLPETSELILLSGDIGDLQPASPLAVPLVDLRGADDILTETITGIVAGTSNGEKAAAKGKTGAEKRPRQEKSAPRKGARRERAEAQEPAGTAKKGEAGAKDPQAKKQQGAKEAQLSQGAEQASPTPTARKRVGEAKVSAVASGTEGKAALRAEAHPPEQSHHPAERSAAAELPQQAHPEPSVAEPSASPSFMELMAAASARGDRNYSFPPDAEDQVRIGAASETAHLTFRANEVAQPTEPQEPGRIPGAEVFLPEAGPGAEAGSGSRKRNKPLWLFLLLFAFFLIPSTAYFVGRARNAQEEGGRLQGDGVAGQRPALLAGATSAAAVTPSRAAAEAAPKGAPPQEAVAHVSGLAALPPFLEGWKQTAVTVTGTRAGSATSGPRRSTSSSGRMAAIARSRP